MKTTRRIEAFTLIELLVVIAIIAVLLTILAPALQKAKQQAQKTKCAAHLHQIAVAFEMYESNYNYRRFAVRNNAADTNLYWMGKLADYVGDQDYGKQFQMGETIQILLCPSAPAAKFVDNDPDRQNPSGQWGMSDRPWEWERANNMSTLGGYTVNGWVVYDWMYDQSDGMKDYMFRGWDNVRPEVPLFGDGLWTIGWPRGTDPAPPDLTGEDASGLDSWDTNMRRFCIRRHDKQVNMIFKDSHAEAVDLADLWKLPWHQDYEYRQTPIQLPLN
ncbi:MAG: prepilin-type N-terminal cleavage/methylation domain-containing protein [Sedimentisphaerales bacterium]|nr:prepilin-type N-terminal cleavage/methylation domain-containing protein [Sedimentisphaerales bacterium]